MLINETPGRIETSPPSLWEKDGVPFTERRDGGGIRSRKYNPLGVMGLT
jgi:hypothetical protein